MKNVLFGPVASRRLGRSLGVDLVDFKHCSYDCIYCQLGPTTCLNMERKIFVDSETVQAQVCDFLSDKKNAARTDVISLAGSGEPTLASNCGQVIRRIKNLTTIPVAVLTNSSLMWREDVREDLRDADMVLPSVDAVSPPIFEKINRPHPGLNLDKILQGLLDFSRIFTGKIFPEVLIIEGINDDNEEVEKIIKYIIMLHPDRVHLNIATRHMNISEFHSPPMERMCDIASMFPSSVRVEIVGGSPSIVEEIGDETIEVEKMILAHLGRRPAVPGDLAAGIGVSLDKTYRALDVLIRQGAIIEVPDRTDNYYYLCRKDEKNEP